MGALHTVIMPVIHCICFIYCLHQVLLLLEGAQSGQGETRNPDGVLVLRGSNNFTTRVLGLGSPIASCPQYLEAW